MSKGTVSLAGEQCDTALLVIVHGLNRHRQMGPVGGNRDGGHIAIRSDHALDIVFRAAESGDLLAVHAAVQVNCDQRTLEAADGVGKAVSGVELHNLQTAAFFAHRAGVVASGQLHLQRRILTVINVIKTLNALITCHNRRVVRRHRRCRKQHNRRKQTAHAPYNSFHGNASCFRIGI